MARLSTKIARLFRQNRAPLTILSTLLLMVYVHFELQMLNILPKHTKGEHVREAKKEKTVREGLKAEGPHFTLNGKEFSIYSGEMHYFRVHRDPHAADKQETKVLLWGHRGTKENRNRRKKRKRKGKRKRKRKNNFKKKGHELWLKLKHWSTR